MRLLLAFVLATAMYAAPTAVISGWSTYKPVFRAGVPFTLSAATSTGSPTAYLWQQISGPMQSRITARTSVSTTVIAPVTGNYTYLLWERDAGGEVDTEMVTVGVTATDSNGVVVQSNANMRIALGDAIRHGTGPWTWYEVTEPAVIDYLRTEYTTPTLPTQTELAGTAVVTGGSTTTVNGVSIYSSGVGTTLQGTGTSWLTDGLAQGTYMFARWDCQNDGSYACRYQAIVESVTDNDTLRFYEDTWGVPAAKTLKLTKLTGGSTGDGFPHGYRPVHDQNTWNYYDANIGVYRQWLRTGMDVYRDQARSFCRNWWKYALGGGYQKRLVHRNAGWSMMIACALDTGVGIDNEQIWDGLDWSMRYHITNPTTIYQRWDWGWGPVEADPLNYSDYRELSYDTRAVSEMAQVYPSHDADPAAARTHYCTLLTNQVNNIWLAALDPAGYWEENMMIEHPFYPAARQTNGKYGTSPWRAQALGILALQAASDAFANTSACNNPTLAATTQTAAELAATWLWNNGRSPDHGMFAQVGYRSQMYDDPTVTAVVDERELSEGTISINSGSNQVIGTGTSFLTRFAPCDGSTYIAIRGATYGLHRTFRVLSCASDTVLTIDMNYPYTSRTNTTYGKTVAASTSCGPNSVVSHCEEDPYGGRNLSFDGGASAAWLYRKTGNATWLDRANYYLGKTFGGYPAGAGSSTGTPAGPYADGETGNLAEILPACNLGNPVPCGFGYLLAKKGKPVGMSTGAGNVPVAMADRLGGVAAADLRTVNVPFWSSMPNLDHVEIDVIQANGATETVPCGTTSPCAVSVDARQGTYSLTRRYVLTGGATRSRTLAALSSF